MRSCGIVILAAGGSSRLGFAKQLVRIDGITLLRRIVDQAIASVCKPVVVVLGSNAAEMEVEINALPVVVTVNDQWQAGMGSSIRRGIEAMLAVDPAVEAVLVALCDQPRITSSTLNHLASVHASSTQPICAAEYAATVGTPAVFAASLFGELLTLPDTTGGRAIIHRHLSDVDRIPVPEAEMDLDTVEDLQRLRRDQPVQ